MLQEKASYPWSQQCLVTHRNPLWRNIRTVCMLHAAILALASGSAEWRRCFHGQGRSIAVARDVARQPRYSTRIRAYGPRRNVEDHEVLVVVRCSRRPGGCQ